MLKDFQHFFYLQETNILSNQFMQIIILPNDGPIWPKHVKVSVF